MNITTGGVNDRTPTRKSASGLSNVADNRLRAHKYGIYVTEWAVSMGCPKRSSQAHVAPFSSTSRLCATDVIKVLLQIVDLCPAGAGSPH